MSKLRLNPYVLTLVYFIISLIGILNHEIWLDEAHHWLLARDSSSLLDLINNTRYEGHPILWNVLLHVISRFSTDPFWMQLFHIFLSSSVVFLFLKKAPFSMVFKILFIFGYFMLFEYNIISRNYIIGVLFIFLAASIFQERHKKFMLLSVYLALAANTHLMFAVISMAFFAMLLFERLQNKQTFFKKTIVIGSVIFLSGLALSVLQIIPPNDTTYFNNIESLSFFEKLVIGFISFFKGIFPIPDFRSIHFWNSNLIMNLSKPLAGFLGLLVYFIPLLLFYKRKIPLFFVYTALIGTQFFFFFTQLSSTRYFGMTYIIIILALWIDHYKPSFKKQKNKTSLFFKLNTYKKQFIYSLLIFQFIGGIIAFTMGLIYPFSNGKKVAEIVNQNRFQNHTIMTPFCEGTRLSPYLKKEVFFLCENSYQSYCIWKDRVNCNFTRLDIFNKLSEMPSQEPMLFISNTTLIDAPKVNTWYAINGRLSVKLLTKLDPYIIRNLDYSIYEVKHTN